MRKKNKYTTTDLIITKVTAWVAGIILIALAIWGIESLWQFSKYEETNDAQVQEYVNPVIARVGGYIVQMNFDENQDVKKGDTLLLIDNREYTLQQEQSEAALMDTRAQVQVIESNVATLEKTARVSEAQIAAAKARLVKQQLDYDRYQKLFDVESATKQQLEHEKAVLDVAASEYQAATDNYQASLSRINDASKQKTVLAAEIQRREALLDRHKLDVSYTVITAPYNGTMGRRTIETGQMIDPGQVLAYIVNKETDKWVVANFKETQVRQMHIGDLAEINADAFPGKTFKGRIISLSAATGSSFSLLPPDNSTGNFVKIVQRVPVRFKLIDNKKEIAPLRVGMNVNVLVSKKQVYHE